MLCPCSMHSNFLNGAYYFFMYSAAFPLNSDLCISFSVLSALLIIYLLVTNCLEYK